MAGSSQTWKDWRGVAFVVVVAIAYGGFGFLLVYWLQMALKSGACQ